MKPIFEAGQSVLMGCQQKSPVHWWMEWAGVGTVLCCVHIVGTKYVVSFNSFFFFSFPAAALKHVRGEKNKWRETKTNCKICCSFDGGWITAPSRSWWCGAARGAGVGNFITCRDPLLISIYPLGSLSRTLNSSGCRWTPFFCMGVAVIVLRLNPSSVEEFSEFMSLIKWN